MKDELTSRPAASQTGPRGLRDLLDAAPLGFLLVEPDATIREANAPAAALLNTTAGRLVGRSLSDIAAPESRDGVASHHRRVMEGTAEQVEVVLATEDGALRRVELRSAPVEGERGRVEAIWAAVAPIAAGRRLEDEAATAEKLESVGLLAGGIAHDFNNILTAIQGNLGLALQLAPDDTDLRRLLDDAERASKRARTLTRQLLTFSKGGAPVKRRAVVTDLVTESVGLALDGSAVRCEFDLPADLWTVEADTDQMHHVFRHLTENAVEAMSGRGTLSVAAANVDVKETAGRRVEAGLYLPPGRYVHLAFEDHGRGIPPASLPKVFDPYFTTKPGGKGLGLATVYSIVRKHGGHICVESQEEFGSVFHLYIVASDEPPQRAPVRSRRREEAPTRHRVLVMDDEELVAQVAARMLQRGGFTAEIAHDGAEALEIYRGARERGEPFDVVLMDLTVPDGVGGKEAIRRFLELDPGVRAVVSSGYSDDPVMAEHERYGFRAVIAKPFTSDELQKTLRRVAEEG